MLIKQNFWRILKSSKKIARVLANLNLKLWRATDQTTTTKSIIVNFVLDDLLSKKSVRKLQTFIHIAQK